MKIKFIDLPVNFINRKNQNLITKSFLWRRYPEVKNSLLIQLLKDKTINSDNINGLLDFLNIKLPYMYFCVMIVNVDKLKEQNNLKIAILNIVNSVFKNNIVFYTIYLGLDKIAVLMNTTEGDSEAFKKFIYKVADKIKTRVSNKFSSSVNIGIGNVYEGIQGINKSYQEAIYSVDYKFSKSSNSIVAYDQFEFKYKDYYYPLDIEKKIINCVKVGNDKEAFELIKEIFEKNFRIHDFPIEIARCLFFDIMSTAIKILADINVDYSDVFCEKFLKKSGLIECDTINEMYEIINDIIYNICIYINSNKRSHNTVLLRKIYEYLNENFTDSNISVGAIARYVGVTPNYLSQFFKEQTGQSVMVYINKMRINKVKEILKYSQENLDTIAKKVGYTNNAILIRTFKKYEGITPGQYRQACMIVCEPQTKGNNA